MYKEDIMNDIAESIEDIYKYNIPAEEISDILETENYSLNSFEYDDEENVLYFEFMIISDDKGVEYERLSY